MIQERARGRRRDHRGRDRGLAADRRVREHTGLVVPIKSGPRGTACARVGCKPIELLIAAAAPAIRVERRHVA